MTTKISNQDALTRLKLDLTERLEELETYTDEKIQIVVQRLTSMMKEGMDASKEAKEDFESIKACDWDAKVLDPIEKIAQDYFVKIAQGQPLLQQEKKEEIRPARDLAKEIEAAKEKRDALQRCFNQQEIAFQEDDDDLYLEDT